MNNNPTWQAAPIHNAKYFFASPTYNKWVKLTAADVHALREVPGFEGTHRHSMFIFLYLPCRADQYFLSKTQARMSTFT